MEEAKLSSYITGFILSIALTLAAYFAVTMHFFTNHLLIGAILTLAVIQLIVQVSFFLHLGSEANPKWKTWVFLFTIPTVLVIIIGAIWIMNHLNYNMTPMQMNQYIESQQGGF